MSRLKHSLGYAGIVIILTLSPVMAQDALPSIVFTPEALQGQSGYRFMMDEIPIFNYDNEYLNNALRLQYQNILLEKMIQRQSAIARTEKSFTEVGVTFKQPAPPRGICEQIPANVPCYKAYPDLYPGAVKAVSQTEDGAIGMRPVLDPIEPVSSVRSAPAEKKAQKPAFNFDAYRWAEITCRAGECKAVVAHNGVRRTVGVGDTIGDGVRIERISALKVEASKDGKTESLQAALAPSRGGVSSPKYATVAAPTSLKASDVSLDKLENIFSEKSADKDPGQSAPAKGAVPADDPQATIEDVANDAVNDPGPPLGDTGLF